MATGAQVEALSHHPPGGDPIHLQFGSVRRPAALSRLVGTDVRGFRHAASNQAMRHALLQHGNARTEAQRGQKAIGHADFAELPRIVRTGTYHPAMQRAFGPRRIEIHATVGDDRYVYVGEVRAGKRRIDMVTMWKR